MVAAVYVFTCKSTAWFGVVLLIHYTIGIVPVPESQAMFLSRASISWAIVPTVAWIYQQDRIFIPYIYIVIHRTNFNLELMVSLFVSIVIEVTLKKAERDIGNAYKYQLWYNTV